jgi:hypothetical protein
MKIEQKHWIKDTGWKSLTARLSQVPQLVLVFGATSLLSQKKTFEEIKSFYPSSHLLLCSTAGEIIGNNVYDDSLALTAIHFEKSSIKLVETDIQNTAQSFDVGKKLTGSLDKDGLVHVMVFSDGLKVNGTALVNGMKEELSDKVMVTGGLVGDGAKFQQTLIGIDGLPQEGKIVVIGFYGSLKVGYGSMGGWDTFGPERLITKSKDNILYELDGQPALALYKEYLGDKAKGLPSTGLLFPLRLRLNTDKGEVEVVRTILAVDESAQSMTFAGDMPEGTYSFLMKANFDRLVDGAEQAANMSIIGIGKKPAELAILISCVGRKLVLKERTEEEVEAAHEVVGKTAAVTGFYSYGEICPTSSTEKQCQLHNQTMTITTFLEG